MAKWHILVLLVAWVLFGACQNNSILLRVQATESESFRMPTRQTRSMRPTKTRDRIWDEKKIIHKTPSKSNPVGNEYPPTRT
ncbi:hypothetical protein RND81_01G009600 [Saponaria officinalis]|uniref:Secreted protein n=1 Tax=Saponaria officinalis TaxID=3572 RepID=A0AAW1NF83_SAPOF